MFAVVLSLILDPSNLQFVSLH